MTAVAKPVAVTINCPDPAVLADFYKHATGFDIVYSDDNAAYLGGESGLRLGFQRVANYQRPEWPEGSPPAHIHIDFSVADLAVAEAELTKLGASTPEHQPGGEHWRVLLDPIGNPFCITVVA